MSTRVVIADDHTIVREGLRRILEGQEGIEVTGEAVNGHEVMERVRAGNFELLLLDLSMPGKSGIELIKQVLSSRRMRPRASTSTTDRRSPSTSPNGASLPR